MTYIPDKLTPVTFQELFNALCIVWEEMDVEPKRAAIELKVAHINVEVGTKFESCHCYNLGNIKALVLGVHGWTGDYTMFTCGEEVTQKQFIRIRDQYSDNSMCLTIMGEYVKNNIKMYSIRIQPPHPWSRFRAFHSLEDGVRSQLLYLEHHQLVLNALETGDVVKYNSALHNAGYYTADTRVYLKALRSRLVLVKKESEKFDWGDVI